jgi:putative ATPase
MHLRNAPTKLMKGLGYGKGYQYDHDVEGGVALDQTCLPEALEGRVYYRPLERGLELRLKEKLDALREARAQARAGRRGGQGGG